MLENVVPRYDWAGLKEAVIELQGPPSAAIQTHKSQRGKQELGAAAVQKQRPASSSVLSLCSRLFGCTRRGRGVETTARKRSSEKEAGRGRGCVTEGAKAATQNLRARPDTTAHPRKAPTPWLLPSIEVSPSLSFCSLQYPLGTPS